MSGDNPLVDSDSKISLRNYHVDPDDVGSTLLTEGYGRGKDETAGIPLSGYLQGIPIVSDESTLGQGLTDTTQSLLTAIQQGGLPNPDGLIEALAGAVELGLDVSSFGLDPLGGAVQWVVLWLLQHFPPLRIILDGLAGNPDAISGYANTWNNIATRAGEVAEQFAGTATSGPGNWSGAASQRYREMAQDTLTALVSVARMAKGLAVMISGFGQFVAGARTVVAAVIANAVTALLVDLPEALCGDEASLESVAARATKTVEEAVKVLQAVKDVISALDKTVPLLAAVVAGVAGLNQRWSGGVV